MLTNFNIEKTLFKNQFHERYQFELNYKGHDFKGLYHNNEITWFNPQPFHYVEEKHLDKVEANVHKKMKKYLLH
ncbi:YheE family protein [bacterium LRH843]|nr:YheE family protein [bacterium LRH843]NEU31924.1 YheE family protein [bacterium LRH843]